MTTFTQQGVTRPGVVLPRGLNYESKLLFHLRAADVLLGWNDPNEDVARALTGEDPAAFTRASAGGQTRDSLGFLRQWGQGIPRIKSFDLDGDLYWEEPGLLLEGARTNGFTKSQELNDAAWTKTRSTCAGAAINATTAPDRTVTADKLVEDGTAGNTHYFERNTPALTNDTQQAWSVFAKAAERSEIKIRLLQKDGTNANVWFDLDAGTVGTETDAVGLIEKYADGWYRCMIMADSANGGTTPTIQVRLGSGGEDDSYDGDGASGVYFWGMQFEVDAAFPSSYIATTTGTVARVADALTYTLAWLGDAILASKDDLTVYARMARPFHADVTGTLGGGPGTYMVSSSVARFLQFYKNTSRAITNTIDTSATDATANVGIPSGDVVESSVQYRNIRPGPSFASDTGTGLSAFSSVATGFAAWGSATLIVGSIGAGAFDQLFGALFELKIARGLRTLPQMRETL